MSPAKAYYSVVQYCPDASRLETVNVGLVLFCPERRFLGCRMSGSTERVRRLFGNEAGLATRLRQSQESIEHRFQVERDRFVTLEDLQRFIDTRANDLRLTHPRPVKVENPELDLVSLFEELVGGRAREPRERVVVPKLEEAFQCLERDGKARLKLRLEVPLLDRPLRVPYAYRNGNWNLVKPQRFSADEGAALKSASLLSVEAKILREHTVDELKGLADLIVVPVFTGSQTAGQVRENVMTIFGEFEVRTVAEDRMEEFIARVRQEAHPL